MHEVSLLTSMENTSDFGLSKILEDETETEPDPSEASDLLKDITEVSPSIVAPQQPQSKKMSHRKIVAIVHENGEICPRTFNQPCANEGHDDPSMNDSEGTNFTHFIKIFKMEPLGLVLF